MHHNIDLPQSELVFLALNTDNISLILVVHIQCFLVAGLSNMSLTLKKEIESLSILIIIKHTINRATIILQLKPD